MVESAASNGRMKKVNLLELLSSARGEGGVFGRVVIVPKFMCPQCRFCIDIANDLSAQFNVINYFYLI